MKNKLLKIVSNLSYFCLFLSIICYSYPLFSQQNYTADNYIVNVQQFGIEDGLLHQNIHSVTEDSNGFIWISTPKGVARYDGYDFKWFTKKNRTGKITNIFEIEQDKDGWLWLVNLELGEIIFLHPETEEIRTMEERFGDNFPYRLGANVTVSTKANKTHKLIGGAISKDTEGNLIFVGESKNFEKLLIYKGNGQFEELDLPKGLQYIDKFIVDDGAGAYWLSDIQAIYRLDKQTKEIKIFPSFYKRLFFYWEEEKYCYINLREGERRKMTNGKDTLIEQTYSAFYRITDDTEIQLVFEPPQGYRPYLLHFGRVWCLGKQGWKVFDTKGRLLFELKRQEYEASLFEALDPFHGGYFTDSRGKVWFFGQLGLSLVEVKENRFKQYFAKENSEKYPFNNSGRGIWANEDTLIVNFEFGGLVQFNNKKLDNFTIFDTSPFFWDQSKTKNSYHGRPIIKDKKNNFWVGHRAYLQKWSADFSKQKKYYFQEKIAHHNTFALYQDPQENIWIGTLLGLELLSPNSETIQPILKHAPLLNSTLLITNIISASDTTFWLCTQTGLHLFDVNQKKVLYTYNSKGVGINYLPANVIHHIYTDKEGDRWIATNEGLVYWNVETNEKQLFTQEEGLSSDEIIAIFEDKHQHLWLASRYGIMQFDKKNFRVANIFLPKDGTTYHRTNRISHYQEKDGTIYFGGYNGITSFHPDDFYGKEKEQNHKVVLTNFTQFDGQQNQLIDRTSELFRSKVITMQPDDRFFRLVFALLNFEDKEQNYYAWKIEGIDKDWNYQTENVLRLSQQPYGTYTLRIKGQGSDGVWSPEELTIQLKVLKPFYLRTWFILLGLGTFLATAFGLYYWRIKRFEIQQGILKKEVKKATQQIEADKQVIENQAGELRKLDKVKSNFFANVSHELRTPLTLILGPISSVLKSEKLGNRDFTLLKRAQQSGKDLLKLVAAILDLSKMEAGKMELQENNIGLFAFTRRIIAAFESHAQNKGIHFTLDYLAEKGLQLVLDREKLTVILNNLLSNAIKFTPKDGSVNLKITDLGNTIQLEVIDTGRGIHPDDLPKIFNRFYQSNQPDTPTEGGTGIGLSLSREFAQIMGGKIWAESEAGKGSTFLVKLPRKEVMGMLQETPPLIEDSVLLPNQGVQETQVENKEDGRPTILLVEDNYTLRDYLAIVLAPYYTIKMAENGKIALEVLANGPRDQPLPDLIISDVMMPIMDGFQLLKALKTKDEYRHLPVIMLTARADIQDKLKALRLGVDDYLLKPFEEAELLARIDNLLKNAQERIVFNQLTIEESEAPRPIISQEEQEWLASVETLLEDHLSDGTFTIPIMAKSLAMSERNLLRKLKKITGNSPVQYLLEMRLNQARKMLENKQFDTIAKVAKAVGFSNVKSFSKRFKDRYGKTPSAY